MIGVIANSSEHAVIREFFELFKTPWEFYRGGPQYEVLLCAGECNFDRNTANVVLVYAGHKLPFDTGAKIEISSQARKSCMVSYNGLRVPIYGESVTFAGETSVVVWEGSQGTARREQQCGSQVVRIGYDLFGEVRTLLTTGQPEENASVPTLELHIALLRELIVASGVPLFEIPPVPGGYRMIACLTHDVDHPSIRLHRFDHTMLGFLYRAVLGSLIGVLRGRMLLSDLLTNWVAAAKLPFVHLGVAKDFWSEFDGYLKLEDGLCSSFFVIPFKDRPGQNGTGVAPSRRAARYGAADLAAQIRQLMSAGCEIGLHGIDAWHDSASGHEELEEVRRITGTQELGVRMHWLYFEERSPVALETAGAGYDSSIGYNRTVGYRTGTTQVYKPLLAARLLELPLHIMDTALFYPGYLDLSPRGAREQVGRIVANATQFGGVVTVNWHDRSLAPERLWGGVYVDLVNELKRQGAWFATATQAVSWFRKRRSAVFEDISWASGDLRAKIAVEGGSDLPGLQLRVYNGPQAHQEVAIVPVASERTADPDVKDAARKCVALP
jgi:hypothetical protein